MNNNFLKKIAIVAGLAGVPLASAEAQKQPEIINKIATTEIKTKTDTIPTDTIPTDTIPTDTIPTDTIPTDTIPTDTISINPNELPYEEYVTKMEKLQGPPSDETIDCSNGLPQLKLEQLNNFQIGGVIQVKFEKSDSLCLIKIPIYDNHNIYLNNVSAENLENLLEGAILEKTTNAKGGSIQFDSSNLPANEDIEVKIFNSVKFLKQLTTPEVWEKYNKLFEAPLTKIEIRVLRRIDISKENKI